jgi:hypothetical protein
MRGQSPGGEAGFDDLHPELVIKVADPKHLRPDALAGHQRIHSRVGTHHMEARTELGVLPDVIPTASPEAGQGTAL